MTHIAVDFETTWDAILSVTRYGPRCYTHHPGVEIYMASVSDGEQTAVEHPRDIAWDSILGQDWVSHNAGFDMACYDRLVRNGEAPERPTDHRWHCTANLAAYLRAPRNLAGACKELLGLHVSKDVRAKTKGLTPQQMAAKAATDPKFHDFYEEVREYAAHDAELCWQLWSQFNHLWPAWEQELSHQTYRLCRQGLPVDITILSGYVDQLKTKIFEARKQLPWLEIDPDEGVALSHKALALECRKAQIPCPKSLAEDSEECQRWEEQYGDQYVWVGAMRDVRKSTTLLRKLESLERRTCDDTFYFGLKYGGAHTMRFSGDAGFNVQNFPKEPRHGVDLRALIRAPEGKMLLIMDLAQIEARVLPWIVGDEKTMKLIRSGISVYEAYARLYHGWTGGVLKKENPQLYALYKAEVLGLGFGCGHVKFRDYAKNSHGIDLPLLRTKQIVQHYRRSNPLVPKLWTQLNNAFRASIGGNYEMELPSGRVMTYFDVQHCKRARKKFGPPSKTESTRESFEMAAAARVARGDRLRFLYGGLLCENLVQATARDVFAHGLLNLEAMGAKILFHVHDEVVLEVDAGADPTPYEEALCDAPEWADGLPVGAESTLSKIYMK